jgi:predicted flap endonuclease-1-like 5' DNA nuclease
VTTGDRDSIDGFPPQFIGKLTELGLLQFAQIAWRVDQIQQRGRGLNGHANTPSY